MARRFSSEGAAGLQGAGPDAAAAEGLAASVTINIGDSVSLASGREGLSPFTPRLFPRPNTIHLGPLALTCSEEHSGTCWIFVVALCSVLVLLLHMGSAPHDCCKDFVSGELLPLHANTGAFAS